MTKLLQCYTLGLLVIILVIKPDLLSAQWKLFPANQVSYYACDTFPNAYQNMYRFKQDSTMQSGGWNLLFFNRHINPFSNNTCYYEPYRNYYNRDTMYLDSIFELNGDYIYFANGDTLIFHALASAGQSWIMNCANGGSNFSQLKFTCLSVTEDSVFSIIDSVKSFLIETLPIAASPVDSFVFKVSKNHGVLNMIPFYYLMNHSNPSVDHTISLRGFETDTSRLGYTFPRFEEFFDIHPGTIIKHGLHMTAGWAPIYDVEHRDSVTEVINIADSLIKVFYHFQSSYTPYSFDGNNYIPHYTCCGSSNDSVIYNRKNYVHLLDRSIHDLNYSGHSAGNLWSGSPIWGPDTYSGINNESTRSFFLTGGVDTVNNCSYHLEEYIFEGCDHFTLKAHVGEYIYCSGHTDQTQFMGSYGWLDGYCVDGVCNGNVANLISGIGEIKSDNLNFISLYPNPATDQLTVTSNNHQIATVTVTDIYGRQVYTMQTNSQLSIINCQLLTNGIYLLHYSDGKNQEVKKFVVEH